MNSWCMSSNPIVLHRPKTVVVYKCTSVTQQLSIYFVCICVTIVKRCPWKQTLARVLQMLFQLKRATSSGELQSESLALTEHYKIRLHFDSFCIIDWELMAEASVIRSKGMVSENLSNGNLGRFRVNGMAVNHLEPGGGRKSLTTAVSPPESALLSNTFTHASYIYLHEFMTL